MTVYYIWYANEINYPWDIQVVIFKQMTGDSRCH